jgi:hypothetical protein
MDPEDEGNTFFRNVGKLTRWRHLLENSNHHDHRCENLKSNKETIIGLFSSTEVPFRLLFSKGKVIPVLNEFFYSVYMLIYFTFHVIFHYD